MKTTFIALAAPPVAAASLAQAAQDTPLSPVAVQSSSAIAETARHGLATVCAPPNSAAECTAFDRELRRNFNLTEIRLLFHPGAATALAGYYATSYEQTQRRYEAFARAYDEQHLTAFASK